MSELNYLDFLKSKMNYLSSTRNSAVMIRYNAQRGSSNTATQPRQEGGFCSTMNGPPCSVPGPRYTARVVMSTTTVPAPGFLWLWNSQWCPLPGGPCLTWTCSSWSLYGQGPGPSPTQLQHCPGPKVVSPRADIHSFHKYLFCICVIALFMELTFY